MSKLPRARHADVRAFKWVSEVDVGTEEAAISFVADLGMS